MLSLSKLVRTLIEPLVLVVVSACVIFLCGELAIRGWEFFRAPSRESLPEQLGRAGAMAPVANIGNQSLAGLVQPSSSDAVVYELKPNISGTFQGKPFSFNRFGMRDDDTTLEKPKDVFRIAGLGDSVMFGWGVEKDESYLKLVERAVNSNHTLPIAHGKKVEILNFAVPGYNTAMEVATLEERALKFDPDLVVIHFVNNDWGVPMFMEQPTNLWSLDRSYFIDFIRDRIRLLKKDKAKSPSASGEFLEANLEGLGRQERWQVLGKYQYMLGRGGYLRAMKKLAQLTGRMDPNGKQIPVLVLISSADKIQRRAILRASRRWKFEVVKLKPYVDELIRRRGIPDTPEARRKALILSETDSHPNALGHEAYADALLDGLKKIAAPLH